MMQPLSLSASSTVSAVGAGRAALHQRARQLRVFVERGAGEGGRQLGGGHGGAGRDRANHRAGLIRDDIACVNGGEVCGADALAARRVEALRKVMLGIAG